MPEDTNNLALDYESPDGRRRKRFRPWPVVLAVFAPTLIQAALITFAELAPKSWLAHTAWYGWFAIAVSIGAGCVLLARSRLAWTWLIPAMMLFIVGQIGWLVIFTLEFCCAAFGDCI